MRKSNIIIIAILLLVSFELLWLWDYLGFSLTDPVDVAFAIVWWVVIIAAIIAIVLVEQRRRMRLRTIFISDGVLYNCETGVIRLPGDEGDWDYVRGMCDVLETLNYGGEAELSQDQPRVRFNYIVRTRKFAHGGDVWSGEVISIANARQSKRFSNARDLSQILSA